jgi:cellulose synthase (UDP-forming)
VDRGGRYERREARDVNTTLRSADRASRTWRARLVDYIVAWLADGLGVSAQPSALDWLVRLFFKPAAAGKPDLARRWARSALQGLAREWGVLDPHDPRSWVWRACVRPRGPRRKADVSRAREALDWLDTWVVPAFVLVRGVWRHIEALIALLPWQRWGARIEQGTERIGRLRWLLPLFVAIGAVVWTQVALTPLQPDGQWEFFAVTLALALLMRRLPGRLPALMLATLSLLAMGRYVWWRVTQTLDLPTPAETIVGYVLFGAEIYTWVILALGLVQTAWPLNRTVAELPPDPCDWPSVDIYIPTYNEPLSVVRPAVFAAQGVDWPAHKLRVYLLDDGRRSEFEAFAREAGIGYLTREDNRHAKAGNINRALSRTDGEYIAIFDCDHVPTRSFLQTTMGTFLRDSRCAMVQTPHHFFSPDPFERNLGTFRRVPNEGKLFYGLVQAGNDLWNASFFCGSCAIIKRAPLEEIGGIAVETVTEDAHTALRLHRRGYTTAYLPTIQAAGLATESLAGHIRQRTRWARGMAQIFRIDNPFLGRGLGFFQRLCYGNAMLHFFYGVPRLIFLVMPMAYLFLQLYFINSSALQLASFVVPYMVLSNIANSRIHGKFRHSFWAEVYESVLAWYIALPTTFAFLSPKYGKFDVTSKGGHIAEGYFDWSVSKPYLALLALNFCALLVGGYRLLFGAGDDTLTIILNIVWTAYNLMLLGAAVSVASEAKQVRVTHRIAMRVPATLLLRDGTTVACMTSDYSTGGLGIELPSGDLDFAVGDTLDVSLSRGDRLFHFPARASRHVGRHLGLQFDALTLDAERQLVQCTFGRADAWLSWNEQTAEDAPLAGLKEVMLMGIEGYQRLIRGAARLLIELLALDRTRH